MVKQKRRERGLGRRDVRGKKDPEEEMVKGEEEREGKGVRWALAVMQPPTQSCSRHETLHSNDLTVAKHCSEGEKRTKYRLLG